MDALEDGNEVLYNGKNKYMIRRSEILALKHSTTAMRQASQIIRLLQQSIRRLFKDLNQYTTSVR